VASAERRALLNDEKVTYARVSDLLAIVPAVTGKVELVYEGEQEGPEFVALRLISQAIRKRMPSIFPNPETFKRKRTASPYEPIQAWFSTQSIELMRDCSTKEYALQLYQVPALADLVKRYCPGLNEEEQLVMMEFLLHGLSEFSLLGKSVMDSSIGFGDLLNQLFSEDDPADNA
jgi:magnesium chelatase subunit I